MKKLIITVLLSIALFSSIFAQTAYPWVPSPGDSITGGDHSGPSMYYTPTTVVNTTPATCTEPGTINIQQEKNAAWHYKIVDASNNISVSSGSMNTSNPISASVLAGTYKLVLTDSKGYAVERRIDVPGARAVIAGFSSVTYIDPEERIAFTSTSVNATENVWDFGDGSTATGTTVAHSYATAGIYTVTIKSSNESGCFSSASHTITSGVVENGSVTGINDVKENTIAIWNNGSKVNVDFTKLGNVQATVAVFNIIGQQLSYDEVNTSNVYRKSMDNAGTGYVIVQVKNGATTITKKLFINNSN